MEKNACLICFFKRILSLWVFAGVWQLFNWLVLLTHVLGIKCNGSWGKFKYQFYVLIKAAIPQAAINCVANLILTPEFVLLGFLDFRSLFLFIVGIATPQLMLQLPTYQVLPPPGLQAKWKRLWGVSAQPARVSCPLLGGSADTGPQRGRGREYLWGPEIREGQLV